MPEHVVEASLRPSGGAASEKVDTDRLTPHEAGEISSELWTLVRF